MINNIEKYYKKYYIDEKIKSQDLNLSHFNSILDNTKILQVNNEYEIKKIENILKSPPKNIKICIDCNSNFNQNGFIKCQICYFFICNDCKNKNICNQCKNITCKYCLNEVWIDYYYDNICENCHN